MAVDPTTHADARRLVEQILRTGLMLTDVLADLLEDLPDDTFPGESPADVLIDMLVGTSTPAVHAAGRDATEHTIALLAAISDRVIADLRGALAIARARDGGARDVDTTLN